MATAKTVTKFFVEDLDCPGREEIIRADTGRDAAERFVRKWMADRNGPINGYWKLAVYRDPGEFDGRALRLCQIVVNCVNAGYPAGVTPA